MVARSLLVNFTLGLAIVVFLVSPVASVTAFAQTRTTSTILVGAGQTFTTLPVSMETIAGTVVTVMFTGTSSEAGTVSATGGAEGRNPVFTLQAPRSGTVTVTSIEVDGFTQPTRAGVGVLNASGTAIADCETTTVSWALGTSGRIIISPECRVPGATVSMATGFSALSPFPRDARYFPQTGFRIDNQTIWDYFMRRGGVATFGDPASRTFLFQGYPVQFFQRRIVQLGHQGQARLLNVLDPGLLAFSSFNFATVPAFDASLVVSAPSPSDVSATLAFVQAHAPNTFQGQSVNFDETFINTVPPAVAFPAGGNPALVPGFDLEMWGIPTSQPAFDPNNHNFIYLRFQRGILMFDATCQCTRGMLLADYLKSILTGRNLPGDLNQEAQSSPLYRQYDPSAPNWVRNPSLLPETNLTNAFTSEAFGR